MGGFEEGKRKRNVIIIPPKKIKEKKKTFWPFAVSPTFSIWVSV